MLNKYISLKELKCFFLTKKEIQDSAARKLTAKFNINCTILAEAPGTITSHLSLFLLFLLFVYIISLLKSFLEA